MVWRVDGAGVAGVEYGFVLRSVGGGKRRMTSKVASHLAVIIARYLGFLAFGDETQAPCFQSSPRALGGCIDGACGTGA